jgi:hypothetical protein
MNKEEWYPQLLKYLLGFEQKMPAEFDGLLFPKLTLPVYYPEDTLVLRPNEIASRAYWPITGFTRTYEEYKPENDSETVKQKTVGISVPGKVTLPANSFMNQSKSRYFVEITKGSTMIGLSYEAFKDLGTQMPEVFMLSNQIVTKEDEDREIERKMRAADRTQGYKLFLEHFGPEVESFIFQMHIACFIGMSPETLSRIRTAGGYRNEHLRKQF